MTGHVCVLSWCVRHDEDGQHYSMVETIHPMLDRDSQVTTQIVRRDEDVEATVVVIRLDEDRPTVEATCLLASEAVVLAEHLTAAAEMLIGDPTNVPAGIPVIPRPRLAPDGGDVA